MSISPDDIPLDDCYRDEEDYDQQQDRLADMNAQFLTEMQEKLGSPDLLLQATDGIYVGYWRVRGGIMMMPQLGNIFDPEESIFIPDTDLAALLRQPPRKAAPPKNKTSSLTGD